MTHPEGTPQVFEGTDIEVDPDEVDGIEDADTPATSDPEQTDDTLGGTGGGNAGGAG